MLNMFKQGKLIKKNNAKFDVNCLGYKIFALDKLIEVCEEAKCIHKFLLVLLPGDEKEKHEIWFKAIMLSNDTTIASVKMCVSSNEGDVNEIVEDDINPEDRISNVCSKQSSHRSGNSGNSSTTSSARIKAEEERAALIACAASAGGV